MVKKPKIKIAKGETGEGEFTIKVTKGKVQLLIHNNHIVAESKDEAKVDTEAGTMKDLYNHFFDEIVNQLGGRVDKCKKCGKFMVSEVKYYIDEELHCESCFKTRVKGEKK